MLEPSDNDDLKTREERKRDAHWAPAERWRVIQETITWADAQSLCPRNSRESCLARQRKAEEGNREQVPGE